MAAEIRVGIDDTDSDEGMCTTYIASLQVLRFSGALLDYPYLVRLNPNIPYKTRGNGALSLRLSNGQGSEFNARVAYRDGHFINAGGSSVRDAKEIGRMIWKDMEELSMDGENTNPGMIITNGEHDEELYRAAVTGVVNFHQIGGVISSALFERHSGNGRGLIGSSAACSWSGDPCTYEVMAYRYPRAPSLDSATKMEIADRVDRTGKTFNTIDRRNRVAAIFPNPRTPVIFGIRGTDPELLLDMAVDLVRDYSLDHDHVVVFRTNQATDHHLIRGASELHEYSSYCIRGRISSIPYAVEGGHYFSSVLWESRYVNIAAFEPTKEFRETFRKLFPGDLVEVCGAYMDGTMNLEKISIISTAKAYKASSPSCPSCGMRMKSRGRYDYRCPSCHRRRKDPSFIQIFRDISTGTHQVPVCARRHLSRPLELGDDPS